MGEVIEMQPMGDAVKHGSFISSADGVFYTPSAGKKSDPVWLCSQLEVVACTRDTSQENWGRLLGFRDPDGHRHTVSVPMSLMSGGGEECIRQLLSGGLRISPSSQDRKLLCTYIQMFPPTGGAMARCTDRIGWHDNGVYVLPEQFFGESEELVIYQAGSGGSHAYYAKGTLGEWQENVGRLCVGNSRLVFAVSSAFAGPLLNIIGAESGGFNFVGGSSSGKTTALNVAVSVCGGPKYLQRWLATANGLEAVATLHNDGLLALDELAQVDARAAGEVVYMLANGSGKIRATKQCGAREKSAWRLVFLSAGEISLATHMATAGKDAMAGQETRLADIPADAGKGLGLFEVIHGRERPSQFADTLKQHSATNYGSPLVTWLEKLSAASASDLIKDIKCEQKKFIAALKLGDVGGQVHRVAERFAIVAAAGELATRHGITGWEAGEAAKGATACFQAWLNDRDGTDQSEHQKMKDKVRHFLDMHGDSRFADFDGFDIRPISNKAGFRRLDAATGGYDYFVFTGCWTKEICSGFNAQIMSRHLAEKGYLEKSRKGEYYITRRLPGRESTKCYHVLPTLFDDGEHTEDCGEASELIESSVLSVRTHVAPRPMYDPNVNPFVECPTTIRIETALVTSNPSNDLFDPDSLPF